MYFHLTTTELLIPLAVITILALWLVTKMGPLFAFAIDWADTEWYHLRYSRHVRPIYTKKPKDAPAYVSQYANDGLGWDDYVPETWASDVRAELAREYDHLYRTRELARVG